MNKEPQSSLWSTFPFCAGNEGTCSAARHQGATNVFSVTYFVPKGARLETTGPNCTSSKTTVVLMDLRRTELGEGSKNIHRLTLLSELHLVTSSCRTLCQRARRSAGPLPKLPQSSKGFGLESHAAQCWVFSISCSHTPHCPPAFTASRPKGLQKAA